MPVDVGHGWAAAGQERPRRPWTRNRSSASLGSRSVASHLSSACLGSASMDEASDGADQSADLDAALEKDQKNMMDSNTLQRNAHPVRHEAATHLFAIGQIVRLKGGFGLQSQSADTYRITATLPPQGDSQQYRIRNDDEHYERVARQDSLEPARILPVGPSGALIEGTFGAGQAIETRQLRDQKSRSRRRPSPSLKVQELG
jgi:hypothetical protein